MANDPQQWDRNGITITIAICLMIMCCVGQIASCAKTSDRISYCIQHPGTCPELPR